MRQYLFPKKVARADHLFVASTSYHVVLAQRLAAAADICPGHSVLLLKRFLHPQVFDLLAALRADPAIAFSQVVFLDRASPFKRRHRAFQDRRRLPDALWLVDAVRPGALFIFNEDPLEQRLARRVKTFGGQVFAVEDGAIAYAAGQRAITRGEGFKNKLFFGAKTRNVTIEGSSAYIDAFFAAFPQHVRPELRHQRLRALPPINADAFAGLSWPGDYLRRLGAGADDRAYDGVFLLARSNNFRALPDYHERMQAVFAQPWIARGRYAISYHPHEKAKDHLDAAAHGITVIHNAAPAELIYLCYRNSLRVVIGDAGTSLMTARWMLPRARAVSLMHYLGVDDPPFSRTLAALGVELPLDLQDLAPA